MEHPSVTIQINTIHTCQVLLFIQLMHNKIALKEC